MLRTTIDLRLGVVLYNNTRLQLERLTRALALNQATKGAPRFDVVFLDNSPTNALEKDVRELAPEATYRLSMRNLGFGAAHNVLMAETFSDTSAAYYLCVNPDAVLHPDCLRELLAEARQQRQPGLVEARQFPDEHPKHYDPQTHETPWCSGCVLLISRVLFQTIGGFDDNFFMYCEDVDLSWRARAAGFSTSIAPLALAHHYVGDRAPSIQSHLMLLKSGIYLARKYGNAHAAQQWMNQYLASGGKPFVETPVPAPTENMLKVANFNHAFHMAEARW